MKREEKSRKRQEGLLEESVKSALNAMGIFQLFVKHFNFITERERPYYAIMLWCVSLCPLMFGRAFRMTGVQLRTGTAF